MKCIKNVAAPTNVLRLPDDMAEAAVRKGGWVFCPKSEWKLATRQPVEAPAPRKQRKGGAA